MTMSNDDERTIPRGDGMDAELISRLEQRLIDTEERLEEKVRSNVWRQRVLYGVIVVMAITFSVTSVKNGLRINREISREDATLQEHMNREDATVDTLSKSISKLVSSTPVTSDGGGSAATTGLTEAETKQVKHIVKDVQMKTTKADFSQTFWHGTFLSGFLTLLFILSLIRHMRKHKTYTHNIIIYYLFPNTSFMYQV